MDTLTCIMNRKSVRTFSDAPVSKTDLEQIVRAGMAAPCAVNQQAWEFIVIDDPQMLRQLGAELPYAKMLLQAQAAIVVCGELTRTFDHNPQSHFWIMDCSAATENILLAVEALGLGAVWTAVYPNPQLIEVVRRTLRLPQPVVPLNIIPIGVPARQEQPKDKWKPELLHWNGW